MKRTHGVKGDTDMKKITPQQIETANVKTGEIFENHDAYTLLFDNSNIQKGRASGLVCIILVWYIKNVGVDEKARGKGLLGTAVAELCGNMPIYLETHTESKVALYGKTGFGLRETSDYHGMPVFAMTRTGA